MEDLVTFHKAWINYSGRVEVRSARFQRRPKTWLIMDEPDGAFGYGTVFRDDEPGSKTHTEALQTLIASIERDIAFKERTLVKLRTHVEIARSLIAVPAAVEETPKER